MRTIEDMRAMAQRQLDGMTVNRDIMAKDVLQLCQVVENAKDRILELQPQEKRPDGSFSGAFSDLFKDIFK